MFTEVVILGVKTAVVVVAAAMKFFQLLWSFIHWNNRSAGAGAVFVAVVLALVISVDLYKY
jgi:hypothetical protein